MQFALLSFNSPQIVKSSFFKKKVCVLTPFSQNAHKEKKGGPNTETMIQKPAFFRRSFKDWQKLIGFTTSFFFFFTTPPQLKQLKCLAPEKTFLAAAASFFWVVCKLIAFWDYFPNEITETENHHALPSISIYTWNMLKQHWKCVSHMCITFCQEKAGWLAPLTPLQCSQKTDTAVPTLWLEVIRLYWLFSRADKYGITSRQTSIMAERFTD